MSTPAQIQTNQKNATLSTGPRTDEGKAKSASNSTRHGLRSQSVLIPGEDPADYERLLQSCIDDLAPGSHVELQYVEIIAASLWRLARIPKIEAELFAKFDDPAQVFLEHGKTINNLIRYQTTIQKAHDQALKQLKEMQALQAAKAEVGFVRQSAPPTPQAPVKSLEPTVQVATEEEETGHEGRTGI